MTEIEMPYWLFTAILWGSGLIMLGTGVLIGSMWYERKSKTDG